jgi:hypothetical protein
MGTVPNLEQTLAEAQRNDRVCPQPDRWNELYEMLPHKKRVSGGWEPGLPVILAAWWDTPALSKMLRLREPLEWADRHGCLERVHSYLCGLAEKEWHHKGEG